MTVVDDVDAVEDAAYLERSADDWSGAHLQTKDFRLFIGTAVGNRDVSEERGIDEVSFADVHY